MHDEIQDAYFPRQNWAIHNGIEGVTVVLWTNQNEIWSSQIFWNQNWYFLLVYFTTEYKIRKGGMLLA